MFFSGYAAQDGDNFMLPVDFDPQSKARLENRALSLTREQDLEDRKASVKIILLDGARNETMSLPLGTGPGLAGPDQSASSETAFLFAAPLNATIASAPKTAGKLAALFSRFIQQPGILCWEPVPTCSGNWRKPGRVLSSETVVSQTFYFTAPPASKPSPAPPPAVDIFTKVPKINRTDRTSDPFSEG